MFGQRSYTGHQKIGDFYIRTNWAVNSKGYLTGGAVPNKMELVISPDKSSIFTIKQIIKLKNFIKAQYIVYRGVKNGKLYIGKALESLAKRYGSEERAGEIAARVIDGLDNIPTNAVALGVEQLVMDLNGGLPNLANKMPATVKTIYVNEAMHWLDNNMPNWQHLLKFQ